MTAAPITQVSNRAAAKFNTEKFGDAVLSISGAVNRAGTGRLLFDSVEVPALRFNDVDVQVRNIDVAGTQALRRELARIETAAGVCDLVAASMRQREGRVAAADRRQLVGKINEPMRDRWTTSADPVSSRSTAAGEAIPPTVGERGGRS